MPRAGATRRDLSADDAGALVPALLGAVHGDRRARRAGRAAAPSRRRRIGAVDRRERRAHPAAAAGARLGLSAGAGGPDGADHRRRPAAGRAAGRGAAAPRRWRSSFRDGAQRLVVNCGGARWRRGADPRCARAGLRTTAAHSTLVLDDTNSTAILPTARSAAASARSSSTGSESDAARRRLEASHDGYVRRFGLVHRRLLILRDDGRELRGEDMLLPPAASGEATATALAVRFHLGAGDRGHADRRRPGARCCAARRQRCGSSAPAAARSRSTTACGSTATAVRSRRSSSSISGEAPRAAPVSAGPGADTRQDWWHSRRCDRPDPSGSSMTDVTIRRALLSVSDKSGPRRARPRARRPRRRAGLDRRHRQGAARGRADGARRLRPHRLSRDDGRPGQDAAPHGPWRPARGARRSRACRGDGRARDRRDRPGRRQSLPVRSRPWRRAPSATRSSRISTSAARRWCARRRRTTPSSRSSPIRPTMPRCSRSWTGTTARPRSTSASAWPPRPSPRPPPMTR